MSKIFDRALKLIRAAQNAAKTTQGRCRCEEVTLCTDYAEPGYSSKNECVAFGNWNVINHYDRENQKFITDDPIPAKLCGALERLGVDIEWSDEWAFCDSCQKAVRTQADSYSWKRSYQENDGGITCESCIDPAEYLATLEGQDNHCSTIDSINPADHKYVRLELDFENGFHPGQDDDPKKIAKALRLQGITRFLFTLDAAGQFDLKFSVWVHKTQYKKFNAEKFGKEKTTCDVSPAAALERGLREATVQMAKLPDSQIKHAAINTSDGSVEVRTISPEDFVSGKAFKKK